MKTQEQRVDGNEPQWQHQCEQLAESGVHFDLINFQVRMLPICMTIAKGGGYELKGSRSEPGICHFIHRLNQTTNQEPLAGDYVFSGGPDD